MRETSKYSEVEGDRETERHQVKLGESERDSRVDFQSEKKSSRCVTERKPRKRGRAQREVCVMSQVLVRKSSTEIVWYERERGRETERERSIREEEHREKERNRKVCAVTHVFVFQSEEVIQVLNRDLLSQKLCNTNRAYV